MRGSLRGRIANLEAQRLPGSEEREPWTAAEFAEWYDATRAEYLRLGYLLETPAGLRRGDGLSHTSHEHSIACLLAAMPAMLRHRGFSSPDNLGRSLGNG